MNKNKKVYSPDIFSYSFEGVEGISNTISYILVAPFRIVSRVMHNICILPADLEVQFASGLILVATVMSVLGMVDLFIFGKWALLASQLPLFLIAYKKRSAALVAIEEQEDDPIIDVDQEEVKRMATSVYEDLDKIL